MMQIVHDFLYTGIIVPPVHIQNIDVVGAKLPQAGLNTKMEGFAIVSSVIYALLDGIVTTLEICGELKAR